MNSDYNRCETKIPKIKKQEAEKKQIKNKGTLKNKRRMGIKINNVMVYCTPEIDQPSNNITSRIKLIDLVV